MANASLLHEAPLEVLRQRPDVVLELLALARQPLPPGPLSVEACATDVTEVVPVLRSADFVALIHAGLTRTIELVIVVEVQRNIDDDKQYVWPQYVVGLGAQHRAPVLLLVWTFDEPVARWARRACPAGPSLRLTPTVIGPRDLPRIRSTEDARAHVELTMLTALTRLGGGRPPTPAAEEEVLRVAEVVAHLPDTDRRRRYASLLHAAARDPFRAILTRFLEVHGMSALELIRNEGREEGRAEGLEQGLEQGLALSRSTLLRLLRFRGFTVDAAVEARVAGATEIAQLERWLDRVLDAPSLEDVFANG